MNLPARLALFGLLAQAALCPAADRGVAVVYQAPSGGRGGLAGAVRIYDHSFAVVIGIDQYLNPNVPKLTGAVRDARTVAAALTAQGFTVTMLLDGQATRKRIMEVLGDELPNKLGKEDRVLVYFAGHGVSTGEGDRALGYLVPVDGDRNRLRSSGLSMNELTAWFEDYPSKHVLYVADACYSGLALSTRALGLSAQLSDYLAQVTRKRVRMVMTAGGAGQEAHEWQGQGLFTRYFLSAITGAADADHDGIVTSDEIAAYVKPNVSQTSLSRFRTAQDPQVGRSGEGEFVFVTSPASPERVLESKGPSPEGGGLPKTIIGRDGAPMVLIPAGEFIMGVDRLDDRPPHPVKVGAFYMDTFEVTFDRYDRFCRASLRTFRRKPKDEGWGRGDQPVIMVSWKDAADYARHYGKRLPTEAEWEYACRAGSTGNWCFGDDPKKLGDYAWTEANSDKHPHPVGRKLPNAWGLFDMHGNVIEWCADWFGKHYYETGPIDDPQGPATGTRRVLRGGSWDYRENTCRSAARMDDDPAYTMINTGFRCVANPGAVK
ncbi:MAG: SUMF1/EgtB/PvdO family nonheme iron enzyme [Candidatus Coatesbacteria bacterium]